METMACRGPVLVGVDGSPGGAAALDVAACLARALDTELIVVHSVGLTARVDDDVAPANQHVAELAELLHGVWTASLADFGPQLRWRAELVWGAAADVLTRLGSERQAAFVVVGSRGHRESAPDLLGSTSHHVVHHSRRPVVVVPSAVDKEH
jgi:nucleotide-binding universal stress UspA family protein